MGVGPTVPKLSASLFSRVPTVRLARQLDDVVNIVEMFDRIVRVGIVFFTIRVEFNSEEFATAVK